MAIPTPHIETPEQGIIAPILIMPGDPLRAKFIADTFLTEVVQFNTVRNMFGYTGKYKDKKISVMGSGMGMPSIGIYSYELYSFYNVEQIIRVGSAGSYDKDVKVYDILLAKEVWSESTYAKTQSGETSAILKPDAGLNKQILDAAKELNIPVLEARIHSSDVFYRQRFEDYIDIRKNHNCVAVEMESFALFANAQVLKKKAACILTISDSLVTHEATGAKERQDGFSKMITLALESI
ncbi:MAG: deoD [Burkholderiales bacterium]|jgi:purine-nucleoside phosphorylase|nr:deoD [Burkholderiales bacterium]